MSNNYLGSHMVYIIATPCNMLDFEVNFKALEASLL